MNYHLIPLKLPYPIEVDPSSLENGLLVEIKKAIDQEWERESKLRPIFNGKIFNVLSCSSHAMRGQFVEYKTYLAQLRNPDLRPFLPIRILGVTGITSWKNKILIGQRSKEVTLYPAYYECAPAGGIDEEALAHNQIDLKKQILLELEEEVGILPEAVESLHPWVLAYQEKEGDYQIYLKIKLKEEPFFAKIRPTAEYTRFLWIEKERLSSSFLQDILPIVPLTALLLREL